MSDTADVFLDYGLVTGVVDEVISFGSVDEGIDTEVLDNRILVKEASDLSGVLSSNKEYYIDGIIDMGTQSIEVPLGGLTLKGGSFDVSQLISTEDNYTMFTSPVGGSGNVLGQDYGVTTSGVNSKVYDLTDATGFNAFEFQRVNYNDCTSIGDIYNYRQGLEEGTGRFGGSPSLTLHGTWLGGYRITTSIVRGMSGTTTEPLFKAGTAFVMHSRFLTDINCDLGTLQPFSDVSPTELPNPSTLQISGAIFTRDGVSNSSDTNIFPNITKADLASAWENNIGLVNTFVGARARVSSENLTVISAGSTWYTLNGIWTTTNLEHFDSPAQGQLRHLGNSPRDFKVTTNFTIESHANNEVGIRIQKWDNSTGSFIAWGSRVRQINSLVGGRDVGFYNFSFNITLDQGDYIYFQVVNNSGNNNVTLELNSDMLIERR